MTRPADSIDARAQSGAPRAYAVAMGAIVIVAVALRLPGLTESVWYDELWSTRVMVGTFDTLVRTIAGDVHPPLYTTLMFAWTRVFGDSELSVRTIPLVSGLATIVLTARLARVYGGRVAACVAALVVALSPPHIWYSQEARHYSLLLLLLLVSLLAFHRIRETNATRWYVAYLLLALCLVFTHYFALAYVGAMTLLALRDRRMRPRMVAIAVATTAALALYLGVRARLWGLPMQAGSLKTFGVADLWRLPFEWFLTGNALGPPDARSLAVRAGVLLVQLAFLALAAIGVIRAGQPNDSARGAGGGPPARIPRGELALLILVVPAALLAIAAVGGRQFYNERSALTALPLFAVAVGVGVAALRPGLVRVGAAAMIAVFGGFVLANFRARQDEWTVYKPNPDYRTIGRVLSAERERTGRPAVVVSMSPALELDYYASMALSYYPSEQPPVPRDSASARAGHVYVLARPDVALVHEILAREGDATVYFARNAYWVGTDPPNHVILASDQLLRALERDPALTVEPAAEAKGLRVFRITRADQSASR